MTDYSQLTIGRRRPLDGPMTDEEIKIYVLGKVTSQGGQILDADKTMEQRKQFMQNMLTKPYVDDDAATNINKIITEMDNYIIRIKRGETIQGIEEKKQQLGTLDQLSREKGLPVSLQRQIGQYIGGPSQPLVRPKIAGRKTRKSKKSKRKTRKSK